MQIVTRENTALSTKICDKLPFPPNESYLDWSLQVGLEPPEVEVFALPRLLFCLAFNDRDIEKSDTPWTASRCLICYATGTIWYVCCFGVACLNNNKTYQLTNSRWLEIATWDGIVSYRLPGLVSQFNAARNGGVAGSLRISNLIWFGFNIANCEQSVYL